MRRFLVPVVSVLALALLSAACGGSASPDRAISAAQVEGGAGFEPATITVHKNDKVTLTVGNSTDKTHGFTIVGYGIEHEVQAGTPIDVEFTASRAGTYEIKCQLHPAHKPATLVVE